MNKYLVVFFNRFANETQTFKVIAENRFRAGRLFYLMHDRKSFYDCIVKITDVEEHYWTEEEIRRKLSR